MVGVSRAEYLGFVFEPPEGPGVNNPVSIALKEAPIWVRGLGITAPAARRLLKRYHVVTSVVTSGLLLHHRLPALFHQLQNLRTRFGGFNVLVDLLGF